MEIKLTKKAALAAADVLNIWLEDSWELTADTRAQVIALDQLLEQLGSAWDEYREEQDQKDKQLEAQRQEDSLKPESLEGWLSMIFRSGDQDETSWKHLGHAFAALVHFGDWQLAQDYERPWMGSLPQMEGALSHWWDKVAKIYNENPAEALRVAFKLSEDQSGSFSHLTAYLDDYKGAAH
jgi:hypothetical protein